LTVAADPFDDRQAEDVLRERAALVRGRRILIVDDNATNRRILVKQALLWGMEPQAAASAVEAIDLVRHGHPYDVAVLDMQMPDMDGARLAGVLRRYRDRTALPLVLLTSVGQRQRAVDGHEAFSAWLNKPIKPAALLEALHQVLDEQAAGAARRRPAAAARQAAPAAAGGILVAEDNTINQKVIRQLLRHLGYRADVVGNGAEAVEAMERQDYQVILMDMQMPEMDGLEATRRLRQRFRGANAPYIIAMTANAMPGDRERCLDAGMDDYVPKPIELEVLARALEQAAAAVAARRRADVLDPARIGQLRAIGDDTDLIEEVIASFVGEVPQLLHKLAHAVATRDGPLLAATAHYLQSSVDFVGANRMRVPCANLELLGKADNFEDADEQLAALTGAYEDTKAALLALRTD